MSSSALKQQPQRSNSSSSSLLSATTAPSSTSLREVACLSCRTRKIKCDKQSPRCSKCVSKGLECLYISHKKTGPKRHDAIQNELEQSSDNVSDSEESGQNKKRKTSPPNTSNGKNTINLPDYLSDSLFDPSTTNGTDDDNPINKLLKSINQTTVPYVPPVSPFDVSNPPNIQIQNQSTGYSNSDQLDPMKFNLRSPYDSFYSPNSANGLPSTISSSFTPNTTISNPYPNVNFNQNNRPSFTPFSASGLSNNYSSQDQTTFSGQGQVPKEEETNGDKPSHIFTSFVKSLKDNEEISFGKEIDSLVPSELQAKDDIYREVGLTYKQICLMLNHCFSQGIIPSMISKERYLKKFNKSPLAVKHLTYIVLAIISFQFPQFKDKSTLLYETACQYIKKCEYFSISYTIVSEFNKQFDENDEKRLSCTFLQSMGLKAIYEYRNSKNLDAALTIASAVRLAQIFGYDRLDPPSTKPKKKEEPQQQHQQQQHQQQQRANNKSHRGQDLGGITTTMDTEIDSVQSAISSNNILQEFVLEDSHYDNYLVLKKDVLGNDDANINGDFINGPTHGRLQQRSSATESPYGTNSSDRSSIGSESASSSKMGGTEGSEKIGSNIESIILQNNKSMTVIEEKRRVFWQIYILDKYYSLVSGLPCAFSVDSTSVIFTKLPSQAKFVNINNTNEVSPSNGSELYYLHDALKRLENDEILIDFTSSRILILTISENIIKWCKTFFMVTDFAEFESIDMMANLKVKVQNLILNFENLEKNLVFFEIESDHFIKLIFSNSFIILYQTIIKKFTMFLTKFEDRSAFTINHFEFYYYFIQNCIKVSQNMVRLILESESIGLKSLNERPPYLVFFSNSVKSLFQIMAYLIKFKNNGLHYQLQQLVKAEDLKRSPVNSEADPEVSVPDSASNSNTTSEDSNIKKINFEPLLAKLLNLTDHLISQLKIVEGKAPLLENTINYFIACNNIIKGDGDVDAISFFAHFN